MMHFPVNGEIVLSTPQEAFNYSITNNKELILKKRLCEEYVKSTGLSIEGFLPQLEFSWNENTVIEKAKNDTRNKSVSFGLLLPVFDGGKTILNYQMNRVYAKLNYYENIQELKTFQQNLTSLFSQYEQLVAAEEIREQNIVLKKFVLDISQIKLNEGLITESDFLESEVDYMNEELELKKCRENLRMKEKEIINSMGLDRNIEIKISPEISQDIADNVWSDLNRCKEKIINLSKAGNLEIKKCDAEIRFSEKQLKYQKNIFSPEISIGASINFSGTSYPLTEPGCIFKINIGFINNPFIKNQYSSQNGNKQKLSSSLNNSLISTLSVSPSYINELRISSITLETLKQKRILLEKSIEDTVENLICQNNSLTEKLNINRKLLNIMKKNTDLYFLRYQNGTVTRDHLMKSINGLNEKKLEVTEIENSIRLIHRNLELLCNIPEGGSLAEIIS